MTSDSEQPNSHQVNLAASGNEAPCGDKADGGPAFPVSTQSRGDTEAGPYGHQDGASTWQFPGLTIRDYFAAKAMHQFMHGAVLPEGYDATSELALIASRAYEAADAMLKARQA